MPTGAEASNHSTDDNEVDARSTNEKPPSDSKRMNDRPFILDGMLNSMLPHIGPLDLSLYAFFSAYFRYVGVRKSGKSCLAALIAKNSDISIIKIYSPDDFLGMDEAAKVAKLKEIFEELSQLRLCILLLDDLEMLIDYWGFGDRYSSIVLRTIILLLRKTAQKPSSNRLIVIATVTSECAKYLSLRDCFTRTIEVPVLTEVAHLMAVIEDSNIFDKQQCQALANRLEKESKKYLIGIKQLLTDIELTKYCPSELRLPTLLQQICYCKQ
ncbi:unnamed protein product [Gongylonema pulchrum]|uniref:Vesicle-fusing ATPase n=1 Tax=Gongylonema pulchrum TaxID=637853 RepID=A0A183DYA3_9BILA|nr:unnamed protein product [Gongylonema pulchrum]